MSAHDFDKMSRDQAVDWFFEAPDEELADVVRSADHPDAEAGYSSTGHIPIPLMLTSIRLPVDLVGQLDEIAAVEGINRSEAIRVAVAGYVRERRGGVSVSEAERALDVLRRVVGEHRRAAAA